MVRPGNPAPSGLVATETTRESRIPRTCHDTLNWLTSKAEYSDFIVEFEIKLTQLGNSGLALGAPLHGDPAFDGMEQRIRS